MYAHAHHTHTCNTHAYVQAYRHTSKQASLPPSLPPSLRPSVRPSIIPAFHHSIHPSSQPAIQPAAHLLSAYVRTYQHTYIHACTLYAHCMRTGAPKHLPVYVEGHLSVDALRTDGPEEFKNDTTPCNPAVSPPYYNVLYRRPKPYSNYHVSPMCSGTPRNNRTFSALRLEPSSNCYTLHSQP